MAIPLLATKFNIPPANPKLVRRERLFSMLDEGLHRGHLLTLVCAPTGYGKTTLVSEWVHQYVEESKGASLSGRFVWLTLDQGDNDLARFIAYLVAALGQLGESLGQGTLATLQATRAPSAHVLATLLINDLAALADPYVVILDDYQAITAQAIHDFMGYLIDHQPECMHLVVISRADPSLPLARLRARGQLAEVRQLDLALTTAETAEYLEQHMNLDVTREHVEVLERRTEGWVAGLQLAALSMRHAEDVPTFIQSFYGGHEYIADYLTGEVLEQQSEEIRDFLLQTCILEQLSGPLCEAVTGQARAGQILEGLKDANLFLVPLDYHGEWYRYHGLFVDLLRKRLHETQKDVVLDLHRKAGRWYAENRMLNQAVEHSLSGQDYAVSASLIQRNAERILIHGEAATFLRWLEAFPSEQMYTHPALIVYKGMALMLLGKIPERELSLLQEIAASSESFRCEADTLRALYAVMKGNAVEAIRLSESALGQLPPERSLLRILAADSLAMAHALRGDSTSAMQAFEQVVAVAQQAGNLIMTLIGLANLAGLRYQRGQLHEARDAYQQVLDISKERLGVRSQPMGRALLGMGELAREWNDLEGAHAYLSEAAESFKQFVDIGLPIAYVSIARVYIAQGEWGKAQAILEQARQHAKASEATAMDDSLTELMQVRVWIATGELDRVERWAGKHGLLERPLGDLVAMAERSATAFEVLQGEYLTLVRLFLAQKKTSQALEILGVLLSYNQKRSQMRRVIEVLMLQGIALQQRGDDESAMQAFGRALELAEPEGYVRTFLDEGQPVAQLLYRAVATGVSPGYAQRLLAGFSEADFQPPATPEERHAARRLVEPLSERELEVLALIAEGLSNREIGARLHISLSTVKGHSTNIYGKLGVKSRTQAVAMAQNLGLLPSD